MVEVIEIMCHGWQKVHLSCVVSSMALDDPGDARSLDISSPKVYKFGQNIPISAPKGLKISNFALIIDSCMYFIMK